MQNEAYRFAVTHFIIVKSVRKSSIILLLIMDTCYCVLLYLSFYLAKLLYYTQNMNGILPLFTALDCFCPRTKEIGQIAMDLLYLIYILNQ